MLSYLPSEQVHSALDQCIREILAETAVTNPPVDTIKIARRLGLVVAKDVRSPVRARIVRLAGSPKSNTGTILLAPEQRPERQQWAVAHEIGEFAAHRVLSSLGVDWADLLATAREQLANHLASALLLPSDWFTRDGPAVHWDLFQLKAIYTTASHELIARRMLECDPPVIISLFDEGRLQWRRSNVLQRIPPLLPAERKIWQSASRTVRPSRMAYDCLPSSIDDIRCWPVHEEGWQREILRTVLEEWV